ncbi:MAG TPA: hypothetical protein VNB90_13220 [Cytophagaceae bacterium]|jgi:hypothetical protein|nr:hypothetical protein [Cytophagaceae bacterium]
MNEPMPMFLQPLSKASYLGNLYKEALEYINKIMLCQGQHYCHNGEMVILIDEDFPDFKQLDEKKLKEIIFLYERNGWKIRLEQLNSRKECLLIFS